MWRGRRTLRTGGDDALQGGNIARCFEFDWDEANLAHVARHGVSQAEAEQVCLSDRIVIEEYNVDYESRLGRRWLEEFLKSSPPNATISSAL
jgi:hypothetical protein